MNKLITDYKFLITLIFFDLVIILLHFAFGYQYRLFNLDVESNLPTVYQGIKLLILSNVLITVFLLFLKSKKIKQLEKVIFGLLTGAFIVLTIDELAQIHENISIFLEEIFPKQIDAYGEFYEDTFGFNSADWLIFYLPAFLIFLGIIAISLKLLARILQKKLIIFLIGLAFTFSVPILELIDTSGRFDQSTVNSLVAVEESFEMFGISLILAALWYMYSNIRTRKVEI